VALSITAGNIAAGAITATKISVSTLSAISADLGTVTAGTVTGATIRTAASGARTEMSGTKIFGYDGSANIWECDSGGMRVLVGASMGVTKAFTLKSGSSTIGGLYGNDNAGVHTVQLSADSIASADSSLDIFSDAPAAKASTVTLASKTGGSNNHVLQITTTGIQIATASGQKVGFFGATPVTQRGAYTQTYSTANKTMANLTSAALTNNTGGTVSTTLAAITAGTTYAQLDMQRVRNALASLADQVNKLRNDLIDVKQFANSIVNDLQSLGFIA